MRFSRGCYDKFHRCPGWIGGGPHWAKVERCKGGYIQAYDKRLWKWRFASCDKCDVIVWPYMTRYLSVFWLKWHFGRKIYNWRDDRHYRREHGW